MATTPPSTVKPGPAPAATIPAPTDTGPAFVEGDAPVQAVNATVGQNPDDIPADPTLGDTIRADGPTTADAREDMADILVEPHHAGDVARLLLAKAEHLGHDIEHDVLTISGGFRVRQSLAAAVTDDLPKADDPDPK